MTRSASKWLLAATAVYVTAFWLFVGRIVIAQGAAAPAPVSVGESVYSERGERFGAVAEVLVTDRETVVIVRSPKVK